MGGAKVTAVSNKEALNREIEETLEEKEVGILAIPEDMEGWISEKNKKALKREKSLLLSRYTYPEQWGLAPEALQFTDEMVFRAIGYHIRIKL